jgi:antitoxin component of MazEF toxin-antitoxin module
MRILKVRKVGNSNVVSIPREFANLGFDANAEVGLEYSNGSLVLVPLPADQRRTLVVEAARRAVSRHQHDMDILKEYDRMPEPSREILNR